MTPVGVPCVRLSHPYVRQSLVTRRDGSACVEGTKSAGSVVPEGAFLVLLRLRGGGSALTGGLGVDLVAVFLRVVPLFPVGRGRVVDEPLVKGSPDSVGSPERMLRASSSTFSIVRTRVGISGRRSERRCAPRTSSAWSHSSSRAWSALTPLSSCTSGSSCPRRRRTRWRSRSRVLRSVIAMTVTSASVRKFSLEPPESRSAMKALIRLRADEREEARMSVRLICRAWRAVTTTLVARLIAAPRSSATSTSGSGTGGPFRAGCRTGAVRGDECAGEGRCGVTIGQSGTVVKCRGQTDPSVQRVSGQVMTTAKGEREGSTEKGFWLLIFDECARSGAGQTPSTCCGRPGASTHSKTR